MIAYLITPIKKIIMSFVVYNDKIRIIMNKKIFTNYFFWTYSLSFIFAILGLVINNNTMTLNKKIQEFSFKKTHIDEQNESLYLEILSLFSLTNIESQARFIGMSPPTHIHLLEEPK